MLEVSIDGQTHAFPPGRTILQALSAIHTEVPHLCHDDRLKPHGGCRLCVVDVEGESYPVSSCNTELQHGMIIRTDGDKLRSLRKTNLQLMAAHYPPAAVAQNPEQPFHRYLKDYDVTAQGLPPKDAWTDHSHPYIDIDMSRCISCYRCVRICDEVQGQFVWEIWNRGETTQIRPATGATLLESECVSCGACVDTCPSGALTDKSVKRHGSAERWTATTCVYCATGCQMEIGTVTGKIAQIRPVQDASVNHGHLCAKGRYAFAFAESPDRVTRPMIRRQGEWQQASWDEALNFIADRFRAILHREGPDAIGVLGSARATNEDNYLVQKFARAVLGTNNVDACARVCHQPSAAALKGMLGTGAATNSFDDIELASTIMLCGCNPTENHPIVGARIKQAVRAGAKLIVMDPRRIELAAYADIHLPVLPGHNIQLLNAMAYTILEEGLEDPVFIRDRVTGLDGYRGFIKQFSPESVAAACAVKADQIRAAARLYAQAKPAMCCHGLGMTEHTQGTETVMALVNLALITGNLGRPGAGINPLRGQNNVQGSAHMGCEPASLTGSQSLVNARPAFERAWGCQLPARPGLTVLDMMDAALAGKLKAIWAVGYDIYPTLADANRTQAALNKLDLVVIQDLFLTETAKAVGHVFLPAASVFEKDGTFMNSDRRVQRVRKAVEPAGDAWPDWRIVCALADRMGKGDLFNYRSVEEVWNEIRQVWPQGAGLSYARMDKENLHWPCPREDHPGTSVLHQESFPVGKQAALRQITYTATPEECDRDFPYLLTTGRTLYHFNAGSMTYRTDNAVLEDSDYLEISTIDALRMNLANGTRVRMTSRHGEVALPVRISERVSPGQLFTSFHNPALFVNRVTSPYRDNLVKTPEYKVTAVAIAILR